MSIVVLSIIEVSMNKISLWIRVDVDDLTADREIIASNVITNAWNVIASNDRSFGCPIICTDTNPQCSFVHWHLNVGWHNNGHSLTGWPYLAVIASNFSTMFLDQLNSYRLGFFILVQ